MPLVWEDKPIRISTKKILFFNTIEDHISNFIQAISNIQKFILANLLKSLSIRLCFSIFFIFFIFLGLTKCVILCKFDFSKAPVDLKLPSWSILVGITSLTPKAESFSDILWCTTLLNLLFWSGWSNSETAVRVLLNLISPGDYPYCLDMAQIF